MSSDFFPVGVEGDHHGSMLRVPIAAEFCEPMITFWQTLFGGSFAEIRPIMSGDEEAVQRDLFWSIWSDDRPQATCHLTIDRRRPILGGLGEVATASESRGRGFASDLCLRAKETFLAQGGKALFLGTVNPAAQRVYQRLGWQLIPGSQVMVLLSEHASPEAFFNDYFQPRGVPEGVTPIDIAVLDASERVAMIPLILYPHVERLLDANLNLYSTPSIAQKSCMGLYGKYSQVFSHNRGIGFAAHEIAGRTIGLATVQLNDADGARIDGFVHPHFHRAWDMLIRVCVSWCVSHHRRCEVEVARSDAEKLTRFEDLGFRITPPQAASDKSSVHNTSPEQDRIVLTLEESEWPLSPDL